MAEVQVGPDMNITKIYEQVNSFAATLSQLSSNLSELKESLSNKEQNDNSTNKIVSSTIQNSNKSILSINNTLNQIKTGIISIASVVTNSTANDTVSILGGINVTLVQIASVISAFRADFIMATNGKEIDGSGYYDIGLLRQNGNGLSNSNLINQAANYANKASNPVRRQVGNTNLDNDNEGSNNILAVANTLKAFAGFSELIPENTNNEFLKKIKGFSSKMQNADTSTVSSLVGSFMTDQQKAEILDPLKQTANDYANSDDPLLQKIGNMLKANGFNEEIKKREKSPTLVLSALAPYADDIKDMVELKYEATKQRPKSIPNYATPVWVVNSSIQTDFVDKSFGTKEEDLFNKRINEVMEGVATNQKDKYGNSLIDVKYHDQRDSEGNNYISIGGSLGELYKEKQLKKGNTDYKSSFKKLQSEASQRVYDRNHKDSIWIDEQGNEHIANSAVKNDIRELGKIRSTGYLQNIAAMDISKSGLKENLNQNITALIGVVLGMMDPNQAEDAKKFIDANKKLGTDVYAKYINTNTTENNKSSVKPSNDKNKEQTKQNATTPVVSQQVVSQQPTANASSLVDSTQLVSNGISGVISLAAQENILLSQIVNAKELNIKDIVFDDIYKVNESMLKSYNANVNIINTLNEYSKASDMSKILKNNKSNDISTSEYINKNKKDDDKVDKKGLSIGKKVGIGAAAIIGGSILLKLAKSYLKKVAKNYIKSKISNIFFKKNKKDKVNDIEQEKNINNSKEIDESKDDLNQLLLLSTSPFLFMSEKLQNKLNTFIHSSIGKEIIDSPENVSNSLFEMRNGKYIESESQNSDNLDYINYRLDTLTDIVEKLTDNVTDKQADITRKFTNDATKLNTESATLGNAYIDQANNNNAIMSNVTNQLQLGTTVKDENGRVMTTSKVVNQARKADSIKLAVVNGIGNKSPKTGKGKGNNLVKPNDKISNDEHIYQRDYSNYSFNVNGDKTKQTLGDSGCGPASAAVVKKIYSNVNNYKLNGKGKKKRKYGGSNNTTLNIGIEHKQIFEACKAAGLSDAAACAVLGNIHVITGGTSDALNYWCSHFDSNGGGIARWKPFSKHVNWARKNGYSDPWTWEANLAHLTDWIINDGRWSNGSDINNVNSFINSTDPKSAASSFAKAFNIDDKVMNTNKFGTASSSRFGFSAAQQQAMNLAEGYYDIFVGSYDNTGYAESEKGLFTLTGFVDVISDSAVNGDALNDYIGNDLIWDEAGSGKGKYGKGHKKKYGGVKEDNDGFIGFGNTHFVPTKEHDEASKNKYNNYKAEIQRKLDTNGTEEQNNSKVNNISNSSSSNNSKVNIQANNSSGSSSSSNSSNNIIKSDSIVKNNISTNNQNKISTNYISNDNELNNKVSSVTKNSIDSYILNKMTVTDINNNGNKKSTTNIYTENNKTTLLTEGKATIVICNNFEEKSKTDLSSLLSNFKRLNKTQSNALEVLKNISDLIKSEDNSFEDFDITLDNMGLDFILKGL